MFQKNLVEAPSAKRTRQSSGTSLFGYLGGPSHLLPNEVPTLRDCLRYCLQIQEYNLVLHEVDRRNVPLCEIFKIAIEAVLSAWVRANPLFTEPVVIGAKRMEVKLKEAWDIFNSIARGICKKKVKEKWENNLDTLFDITKCRCVILLCGELGTSCRSGCDSEAHCLCSCPKELKLPLLDLRWLKAQREKKGSRSAFIMGSVDMKEAVRLEKQIERKKKEEESARRLQELSIRDISDMTERNDFDAAQFDDMEEGCELLDDHSDEDATIETFDEVVPKDSKRNYLNISNAAQSSIRFGVSHAATAEIINGAIADLMKAFTCLLI